MCTVCLEDDFGFLLNLQSFGRLKDLECRGDIIASTSRKVLLVMYIDLEPVSVMALLVKVACYDLRSIPGNYGKVEGGN